MKPGGSRAKGSNGEREVLRILEDELGVKLTKNRNQTDRGGRDLIEDADRLQVLLPFAVEVKRQEKECLPAWWAQTVEQARSSSRFPVLFFRSNRRKWRVAACPSDINPGTWPKGRDYEPVVMSLDVGLQFLREAMNA